MTVSVLSIDMQRLIKNRIASDLIQFAMWKTNLKLNYIHKCTIKYADKVYDEILMYFDREEGKI